jgi:aquaporin Z
MNRTCRTMKTTSVGLAMGSTAIVLVYSPWGKQSGAHLNPSVTLTFLRLGKVSARDALMYAVFQSLGGLTGLRGDSRSKLDP